MSTFKIDENTPILIEFKPAPGVVRTAAPSSPGDLVEKSEKALNNAMNTIYAMARRINATIGEIKLSERPSRVQVDFGLVLTAEANALVAQASTEASFIVKLTWESQEPRKPLPEMD
ncbi:MAG: hypothetical protein HY868_01690 [Chloroflexi bacterium]|nr:hypothetical protein [Chloroflexota bacterium]